MKSGNAWLSRLCYQTFLFAFISETRFVSLPDRDLNVRWAYVPLSCLFLMLICGQVSNSCSHRHRSFPCLWPAVSALFLITEIRACVHVSRPLLKLRLSGRALIHAGKGLTLQLLQWFPRFPSHTSTWNFHPSCQDSAAAHKITADLPQFTAQSMTAKHYWESCSITVLTPS